MAVPSFETTTPSNSNSTTNPVDLLNRATVATTISIIPAAPKTATTLSKLTYLLDSSEPITSIAPLSSTTGIFRTECEYLMYLLPPNFPKPAPPIGSLRTLTCCHCKFTTAFPGEPHLNMRVSRFCKGEGRGKECCRHQFCEDCIWSVVNEGGEINAG